MIMESRDNNCFDILRHFAAYLVLFSHHFALSGMKEPMVGGFGSYGHVAVVIFFAISGFFMPLSFARSDGFIGFMSKRCRRIFPALIACSFIMLYVIGLYFTKNNKVEYLFSYDTFKSFISNSVLIQQTIPTVFSDFIFKDTINGSLWTLPIEFACYIIIATLLSCSYNWRSSMVFLVFSFVLTLILNYTNEYYSFYTIPLKTLASLGIAFSIGALLSQTQSVWVKDKWKLFFISLLLFWVTVDRPEVSIIGAIAISVIVIVLGTSFPDKFIRGRFDISYGVYIYAFPVQQIIINRVTSSFWLAMLLTAIFTTVMACLSYRYIERPFIRRPLNKDNISNDSHEKHLVSKEVN